MMGDPLGSSRVSSQKQKCEGVAGAQNEQYRPRPRPHGFVYGNSHENFLVGHPSWIALARTRLTSEFRWNSKPVSSQKSLVLGRDKNIHIRLAGSTPMVWVCLDALMLIILHPSVSAPPEARA